MRKITDKLRRINPFARKNDGPLPRPLPGDPSLRVVKVFVEGYEDVAFWRGVFDCFANPYLYFEISVPTRKDLPKGKKVLMSMIPESSERMLLCVDSDFDFLFNGATEQSRLIRDSRYMFHTYTYATENYLCYAPSLHNVCVKATKNDTRIFDFERFMADYSRTIYRLFLWYAYSAKLSDEHVFTLVDFKSSVRLNYLDLEDNGARTIAWLQRNVARREQTLASKHPKQAAELDDFAAQLGRLGDARNDLSLYARAHVDGQRGDGATGNRMRKTASDDCGANHCLEKGGRGAEKRNEQLHQYPAIDPGRAARQRELSGLPSFQTALPGHRAVYGTYDLADETAGRGSCLRNDFFDRPRLSATVNVRSGTTKMPKIKTGCLTSPILTFSPLSECTLTGGGFQFHGFVRQSLINLSHCNKMDNLVVLFLLVFLKFLQEEVH